MNIRTLAIAAAMVALLVIIALSGSGLNPWIAAKRANARADVATQQAAVETKTAEVTADTAAKTIVIHRITQGATEYVKAQPGATDALPPAVALAVRACLERLRVEPEDGGNQPACDVPGAVP
jgi:hypothetical protein